MCPKDLDLLADILPISIHTFFKLFKHKAKELYTNKNYYEEIPNLRWSIGHGM